LNASVTGAVENFEVPFEGTVLKGDHFAGERSNRILYLHGAGQGSRHGHGLLRSALQQRGLGSIAFDFIGHGETGGLLAQSSLASRTRQAEAVARTRPLPQPLAVIGASMGAYNALQLTKSQQVDALVLIVPGVYTPAAYEVPFAAEFSSVIRRERSWVDSDAWDILSRFQGRLQVIAAEHDATIPLEIPERLVAAAERAESRELHVVPGAEHNYLWGLLAETSPKFDALVDRVADTVEGRMQK
jgi:pimeloyl-ACP methyl ester carboxylesterase